LSVDIFPYIDIPVVSVLWFYSRLSREETQSTLTTGISMYGKISTDIVTMAELPSMAMRIAITTNV